MATLAAAFVIYAIAAMSGFVSARPALIVLIGVGLFGVVLLVVTLLDVIRYRKHVLPLFGGSGWPPVKSPDELVYRRIYTRLVWSVVLSMFLIIPAMLLVQSR